MGIMEEIDRKGTEKTIIRLNNEFNKLNDYFESWDFPELNNIVYELENIVESGIYRNLIDTAKNFELSDAEITCMGKYLQPPILKLIIDNHNVIDVFKAGFSKNFDIYNVLGIYRLIRLLYILKIDGELEFNEEVQVYLGGLDERIIWGLDDFDTINTEDIPEWNADYFQQLENISWRDDQSKMLYDKLREFMENRVENFTDLSWSHSFEYRTIEDSFFKLIVSCSALNQGKTFKDEEDIIRTYTLFLKLIRFDVTEYLAHHPIMVGRDSNNGYLVCKNCDYRYHLQNGESPDEFVKECECGGQLEYIPEKGNIIPEDIFLVVLVTLIEFSGLISYYMLRGFHEIWLTGQGRYFVFALAIIIFIIFYFSTKSFLRVFGWEMGINISDDPDKKIILLCKSCEKKYELPESLNLAKLPKKCSCGGKLSCVESEEWDGISTDLRGLGRAKYIPIYFVSTIILFLIFRALNLDFGVFADGEHKYIAFAMMTLLGVYMVMAIIRLLRYFGLKVYFN